MTIYDLFNAGWTVEKASLYDEEGIEGWRWFDPQENEHSTVIGNWSEQPPLPDPLPEQVESGSVRCGALRQYHSQYTGHRFTESVDEQETRKQAMVATAGFIADDRRQRELVAGGTICRSHGLAVLVTHVNDGEPCTDYLDDEGEQRP